MQIKRQITLITLFLTCVNVLFFSFPSISQAMSRKYITYKIETDSQFSCVNVSGTLNGESSGEYLLRLPTGEPNINFNAEKGNLTYTTTSEPTLLKVKNDPNVPINFKYKYCNINPYRNIDFPIIERNFIMLHVHPTLITFEDNTEENIFIGVDLSDFSNNLKSFTSFNYNTKKFVLSTSIEDFRESIISVGDFEVDKFKINENQVYIISNGSWPYIEKDSIKTSINELVKIQRDFWNDYKFPMYAVFLVKQNLSHPVPKNISGKHKKNVSILFLPEENNYMGKILPSMSHEFFHAWIGMKMKLELPQGSLQWFVEGFNDFYGLFLAKKSSVISLEEYIDFYNFILNEYYLSPIKNVSNETIKNHFQARGEFNRLATLRGHFIAKELRDKLDLYNRENKFDLAMKEVFSRYQTEQWSSMNEHGISAVFEEYIGKEKWDEVNKFINGDKELTWSPDAFSPFAKLAEVEMEAPEFGFNLRELIFKGVIENLDPNSNAYKVGLREGDKVKYYQLDHKAPLKEVVIAVDEKGFEKIIKFKPKVVKKMVPQYVMVRGDVFEKRLKNRT